jgi:hypothetical protein
LGLDYPVVLVCLENPVCRKIREGLKGREGQKVRESLLYEKE